MTERILIADDSLTMREAVQHALASRGARVEMAADGVEALERVRASEPRLLVADVHMPRLDGYALCREAKVARPELPVLLMVGTFEPFDSGAATEARADGVIRKPFHADELLRKVEEIIGRAPEPQPAPRAETPGAAPERAGTPAALAGAEQPPEPVATGGTAARLSDEDVERVARRVLELDGIAVLERIARELLGEAPAEAARRAAPGPDAGRWEQERE